MWDITNKTALVTGAGSGIGRATVSALAAKGARIIACDINPDSLAAVSAGLGPACILNKLDDARGRQVWFQYRDTCLTFRNSYYARLNYVHNNPIKHGIVARAENYRWCSAAWFAEHAEPGFRKTVSSFRWDKVNVEDDFGVGYWRPEEGGR